MDFEIITPFGKTDRLSEGNTVLALGTFDGVHIAHRALFSRAKELKEKLGGALAGAWCFSDAPASYLKKESTPLLTPLDEKISLMLNSGLDFVAVGRFENFCNMEAEDFVKDILISRLGCTAAVCGFNHRFGRGASGDPMLLAKLLGGDRVVTVDEIKYRGTSVSSSAIRRLITSGEIEDANAMLGRPYSLSAPVVEGKKLGRRLNFPTANQFFPKLTLPPKSGIYATVCIIDGKRYVGVSNVGIRPTITDGTDSHVFNCETYIVDFDGDIYGQSLTVEFHKRLRDEMRFPSVDELRSQIKKDTSAAINYFGDR